MFQYFFIRSRLSGLVCDIEGESREPGTHIIMYEKKDESEDHTNQLFYIDPNTRSIRSAMTDMCISVDGDEELIVEYYSGGVLQEWEIDGDKLRNVADRQVADIIGESTDSGAKLCKYQEHGGINQQFDFEYMSGRTPAHMAQYEAVQHNVHGGSVSSSSDSGDDMDEPESDKFRPRTPSPAESSSSSSSSSDSEDEKAEEEEESEPKYFYIRSAMHGKVLDVEAGNPAPGANLIVWSQNDGHSDNQLWFAAGNGVIRSKLNSFVIDCCDGDLKLYPGNEHASSQGFRQQGDHITSIHDGRCVDIAGENQDDGAKLCAYDHNDGANQRWEFQYI